MESYFHQFKGDLLPFNLPELQQIHRDQTVLNFTLIEKYRYEYSVALYAMVDHEEKLKLTPIIKQMNKKSYFNQFLVFNPEIFDLTIFSRKIDNLKKILNKMDQNDEYKTFNISSAFHAAHSIIKLEVSNKTSSTSIQHDIEPQTKKARLEYVETVPESQNESDVNLVDLFLPPINNPCDLPLLPETTQLLNAFTNDKVQEEISSIQTDIELLKYRFDHIQSILDKNRIIEQITSEGFDDLHNEQVKMNTDLDDLQCQSKDFEDRLNQNVHATTVLYDSVGIVQNNDVPSIHTDIELLKDRCDVLEGALDDKQNSIVLLQSQLESQQQENMQIKQSVIAFKSLVYNEFYKSSICLDIPHRLYLSHLIDIKVRTTVRYGTIKFPSAVDDNVIPNGNFTSYPAQHITDSLITTIGYYMQTVHHNLLSFFLTEYQFPTSIVADNFVELIDGVIIINPIAALHVRKLIITEMLKYARIMWKYLDLWLPSYEIAFLTDDYSNINDVAQGPIYFYRELLKMANAQQNLSLGSMPPYQKTYVHSILLNLNCHWLQIHSDSDNNFVWSFLPIHEEFLLKLFQATNIFLQIDIFFRMNDEIRHTDVSISLLYSKLFNGPTIDLIPIHIPLLSISLEPIAIYQFIDTEPKKVDLSDLRKELFDDNPMFSSANDINKISDSSPPPFDIPKSTKMNEYVVKTTDGSPQNMETIFHTNYDINIYSFESIIAFQNSSISRTNIATSIQIISNFSPTQHQLMKRYLPSKENDHYHTFIHHHIDKWIHITFIRVPNNRTFISFAGHSEIHPQCDQRKATFIAFFEREAIIQLNLTFETTNWMNHYKLIIAIFRQNLKASIDGLCISYAKYYSSLDEPSLEKLEKDYEQIQLQAQYLW